MAGGLEGWPRRGPSVSISHGRRRCLKRNIAHNFDGPLSIKLVLVVLIRSPAYQIKALMLFLFQNILSCRSVMLLIITKNNNHANSVHYVEGFVWVPMLILHGVILPLRRDSM